ncbi:uncharacterized protein PB18E9.04c-like [Melanaphis sacchari]|uniref:uncharacterized protein PB18E9.04c-like n=1 Tax=Melanaphis sacchari TaxID=742174 RepID=UPI000DC1596E|nr:uncharacterized protein PB18E9.04c-like [Melanaphis sacchari]
MAGLKIFITVALTLVAKDGVFSCSLRSHKHGSSQPCWSPTSNSTSSLNLTPVSKPNTISSPCDSSASPSSCSSSVHANGSPISSTPTLSPDLSSSGSTPLIPPTPPAPSNVTTILKSIIQMLSSPAYSNVQVDGKAPTSDNSILPSSSTSNAAQLPASVSKQHTTSSACASDSSSSSSILPNPSCNSVQSIFSTVSIPKLSYSPSTPPTIIDTDIIQFLLNVSSSVPSSSYLSNTKPTHLSPPCHLFTSALNKNVVPGTKSCAISHHVAPSLSVLPGVTRGSSSPPYHPVHGVFPVPASGKPPASFIEHELETAPEEFPAASNVPVSIPVVTSTSTPPSFAGYNPVFINLLLKLIQSAQSQAVSSSPLTPTKTYDIHMPNVTPVSVLDKKPHTISPACASSSESSSSCLSNVLNNQSNSSISPFQQMLISLTPPPVSSIPFGYNPESMKLVIKHLISNNISTSTSLSSLFPLLQLKLNATPTVSSTHNPIPTSTFNRPLSDLNPNVFNLSSNNTFDSTSGSKTNQNTSITNNQDLAIILMKLFSASNASKTSFVPCSPSSNSYSSSTLNTTSISPVPCIPPVSSLSDILSKFSSLKPVSKPPLPSIISSPIITPLSNVKPLSEQNLAITPTSYPITPSSDINPCRSKHKRLPKLSSSTLTGVNLCLKNVKRPHTPHLPLPCSLSPTKLSSPAI